MTIFLVSAGTAAAHPTRVFRACAAYNRAGSFCEERGVAYSYGRTVRLRGQVQSSHTSQRALVVQKKPFASLLLAEGVPVFDVSRILGHASAAFTMDRYGHLMPRHADGIRAAIGRAYAGVEG